MGQVRIHVVEVVSGDTIITRCGLKAFKSGVTNEYDTAECNRIHAVPHGTTGEEEPTCKRCLKPRAQSTTFAQYPHPRMF